ncbi:MAG: DUF6769 family protein [Bacteroides sp.]
MRKKRYISVVLMFVSFIMLTASVLPHHHHYELLCLQHDVDVTQTCDAGHQHDEQNTCKDCCITKFHSVAPQHQVDLQSHYPLVIDLFRVTDVLNLLLSEEEGHNYQSFYIEFLHSTRVSSALGLRAPPCPLV